MNVSLVDPLDVTAWQALARKLAAELSAKDQHISLLNEQVQQHQAELALKTKRVALLEEYLANLRRQRYGRSSEAFNPEQTRLFEEAIDSDIAQTQAELEKLTKNRPQDEDQDRSQANADADPSNNAHAPAPKRRHPVRTELPEDLPRVIEHLPAKHCQCSNCAGALHQRGEESSEKLAIKTIELYVRKIIRPIMACRSCELQFYTPSPAEIIDGGMPDASVLAYLLYEKYHQHVPLYRQLSPFERAGLSVGQSTLCDWVGRCGAALKPLVARLRTIMQQQAALHVDETPVTMLTPGTKKNGKASQQAYVFAYRGAELNQAPMVVFDFQASRSGASVQQLLANYAGALVVDDFAGYKRLFETESSPKQPPPSASTSPPDSPSKLSRPANLEIACFAHARRKFFELHTAQKSTLATQALEHMAEIYQHEQVARSMTPEERYRYRKTHTEPILNAYMAWLKAIRAKTNDGTGIARAIDYTIKREASFRTFLTDGRFPIDNNAVENAIRPIALGRKNWLFAGSKQAGERAAAIMSLIETAKANNVDVLSYLTDILTRLPTQLDKDIDQLLPMNWKPAA